MWEQIRHPTHEEGYEYHVVPEFGRLHQLAPDCWCHPERDRIDPTIIVHNVEH